MHACVMKEKFTSKEILWRTCSKSVCVYSVLHSRPIRFNDQSSADMKKSSYLSNNWRKRIGVRCILKNTQRKTANAKKFLENHGNSNFWNAEKYEKFSSIFFSSSHAFTSPIETMVFGLVFCIGWSRTRGRWSFRLRKFKCIHAERILLLTHFEFYLEVFIYVSLCPKFKTCSSPTLKDIKTFWL